MSFYLPAFFQILTINFHSSFCSTCSLLFPWPCPYCCEEQRFLIFLVCPFNFRLCAAVWYRLPLFSTSRSAHLAPHAIATKQGLQIQILQQKGYLLSWKGRDISDGLVSCPYQLFFRWCPSPQTSGICNQFLNFNEHSGFSLVHRFFAKHTLTFSFSWLVATILSPCRTAWFIYF